MRCDHHLAAIGMCSWQGVIGPSAKGMITLINDRIVSIGKVYDTPEPRDARS
ncbi:MAG: hypothetical protein ABIR30_06480 [Chitinophagaceae bacterium]